MHGAAHVPSKYLV